MPWTFFLPAALRVPDHAVDGGRPRRTILLCFCWAGLVMAFFTVSDRLEHYAFPILPAMAIPIGMSLWSGGSAAERWVKRGFLAAGIAGLLVLIAGGVIYAGADRLLGGASSSADWSRPPAEDLTDYSTVLALPREIVNRLLGWPLASAIGGLSAGLILGFFLNRSARRKWAVASLAAAMAVFVIAASRSIRICEPVVSSKAFGEQLARIHQPGDRVVIIGDYWTANSINFYAPVRLYIHEGQAHSFRVAQQFTDAPKLSLSREELIEFWQSGRRVFVLGELRKLDGLPLPGRHLVLESGGRALWSNRSP
jgi:4-amino-4-deoxy-L-arabinose transferase-like glycosyltransferase